jgi:UDP-glucose 4-epimerase
MKTVVFGGSGFLGSHVADALTEAGHDVLIYDEKESPYLTKSQRFVKGDILDAQAVRAAIKGCDYVYHFAGLGDLDHAQTRPIDTVTQNIQGALALLDVAKDCQVKRFIYASTVYVYSEKGGFYRCSKQAAELYIEEYQRRYGLEYTILRYGTVYGPRATVNNSIYRYLEQALKHGMVNCSGTGDEVREYIFVKDAAKLSVDILEKRHGNKHIIITGHHPMKFRDFLDMVNEILGGNIKLQMSSTPRDSGHYNLTPYSFNSKIGYKLTSNSYLDMGQGLLECISDINNRNA